MPDSSPLPPDIMHSDHRAAPPMVTPMVTIIGAGPAGLFAAEILAQHGCAVQVFDHMARPGRKLLMAGHSGLNLTHSESLEVFLSRYGTSRPFLEESIRRFPPSALQDWARGLGQDCFTGSSGRIFLKSFKASPLLRAWLIRLEALGVRFFPRHHLSNLHKEENDLILEFSSPDGPIKQRTKAALLALGGASWAKLGSTGQWADLLAPDVTPFEPANCGFLPAWPSTIAGEEMIDRHEGATLRGITLSFEGKQQRGDLILTRRGLEGAPLYALSALLRNALKKETRATLLLNLRPLLSQEIIEQRLAAQRPRESRSNRLRKALNLSPFERAFLHLLAPEAKSPRELAIAITALPLPLSAPQALDRAISTAGGLHWAALTPSFMLKNKPGLFAVGEMLDWDAPTGGYLLQACFSTAFIAAHSLMAWLSHPVPSGSSFSEIGEHS